MCSELIYRTLVLIYIDHSNNHLKITLLIFIEDFDPNTIFQAFFGGGGMGGFHSNFGGRRHGGGFPGQEYHFSFG